MGRRRRNAGATAKCGPEREILVVQPPVVVAEPAALPALDFKKFWLMRMAEQAMTGEMSESSKKVLDVLATTLEFVRAAKSADPLLLASAMDTFDRRIAEFRESVLSDDAHV